MSSKEQIIDKIRQVIAAAAQFKEEQFSSILGGLIRKGGKEAEFLLVKYITLADPPAEVRLKIIQAAGDIQSPLYLVPLKKVIDQEPNIHLKKAAVLAVASYNNQQALNSLNACLQTVSNPILQKTIAQKIDNIKRSNPVLALMPRFLKGDKDKKAFMVVMGLLKKTITPADVLIFVNYLKSPDPSVRDGAFDLLCSIGDRTVQSQIFDFFSMRIAQLTGGEPGKENGSEAELYSLTKNIKEYFLRFPYLIFPQLSNLKSLYPHAKETRTQKIFISIFCHCRAPEALSFVKEVYNDSDPELKEYIIEEAAENEQAVEFLFERYRAGHSLKEKVLKALLKNPKGFSYFSQHFFTFDERNQEMIVKYLPYTLETQMVGFIKTLFKSGLEHLKTALLSRIRANYLFSFKDILFDPEREKELFALKEDYLSTISQLFPVHSVKQLLERSTQDELEVYWIKDHFRRIIELTHYEVAISFKEPHLMSQLATKVINACSIELNEMFLNILEKIKTFDLATYKNFYDALIRFIEHRGDNLVEEENYAIKRVRDNFKTVVEDIKKIESLEKEVKRAVLKAVPDLGNLRKILETYHIGAAFKITGLTRAISDYFKKSEEKYLPNWREFFKELPILTQLIREASAANSEPGASADESFHDKLRIVICFQEKEITALFKDQFNEILPHFNVIIGRRQEKLEPFDILLCDSHCLREFINAKTLAAKRIFVMLENRNEFATFKALNARTFLPPLSVYRILKFILQEMYLLRSA